MVDESRVTWCTLSDFPAFLVIRRVQLLLSLLQCLRRLLASRLISRLMDITNTRLVLLAHTCARIGAAGRLGDARVLCPGVFGGTARVDALRG